jgi:hypothetical protein
MSASKTKRWPAAMGAVAMAIVVELARQVEGDVCVTKDIEARMRRMRAACRQYGSADLRSSTQRSVELRRR